MSGTVFDFHRGTTHDGPGMRTSVFFKGCPLRCEWCHNPEGIDATGTGGKEWELDALVREAAKDNMFFAEFDGGVTVSGGEPLLQNEFAAEFLKKLKEKGISTALDTCGFYKQSILESVFPYVDIFLYDIKLFDSELHRKYTGVDNRIILENFKWLISEKTANSTKKIWVRTPLVSEATATDENIHQIGSFLHEYAAGIDRWELCAFNNVCKDKYKKMGIDWKYQDSTLMTQEEAGHCFDIARSYLHEKTVLSGLTAHK